MDDESGPFNWIEIANEFGIKPWAGLFYHNVDATEAAQLSTLVNAGLATTAIHAKSSVFFYYDHGVGRLSPGPPSTPTLPKAPSGIWTTTFLSQSLSCRTTTSLAPTFFRGSATGGWSSSAFR